MAGNKDVGFIKIYRSLFTHWIWENDEPFDKRSAWIDLLRSARFQEEPKKEFISGKLIEVNRGQLIASVRFLKERWKWGSNTKVENFLALLEKEGMITIEKGQGVSVLNISGFSLYNCLEETERTENGREKDTERTSGGHAKDEIKNIITKQLQEENKSISPPADAGGSPAVKQEFILSEELTTGYLELQAFAKAAPRVAALPRELSKKEFSSLRETYSQEQVLDAFGIMENMKSLKGKTSAYLTALNILKSCNGTKDVLREEKRFEELYKSFLRKVTAGEIQEPRLDSFERKSLRKLMEQLFNNSTAKTWDGAFKSLEKILDQWSTLDSFTQKRTKLEHIDRDLISIITQIKTNAGSKKPLGALGSKDSNAKTSSERKDY